MSNVMLEPGRETRSQGVTAQVTTATDWGLLFLRLAVGLIFMVHGSQKLFGAFGGPGLAAVVKMMGPLGYLVSVGEFFGGLGIVVGFLSRFSSASLILIMLGAIGMVHAKNGLFMNWSGKQAGEGFEYHLLVIGMCLAILIAGPGRLVLGPILPLPKKPETKELISPLQ